MATSVLTADLSAQDVRDLDPFSGIGISVKADVFFTQARPYEIRIEGDEGDVRDLITEVRNGFLKVRYDNYMKRRSKLTIHISSPELEGVKVSGSARFEAEEEVNASQMEMALSGSGMIAFGQLDADEMKASISGSGNVEIGGGNGDELDVKISGSGKMTAEDFRANECDVKISGSGSLYITVEEELDAKISGSGKVYYHGNPVVNSVSSGSGKVLQL